MRRLLGSINEAHCSAAVAAMKEGRGAALGAQMTRAQADFDALAAPMCPQELAAPKLHAVLTHPGIQRHVHGAKGVGSQGDGSAQLLCKSADDMRAVVAALEDPREGLDVACMMLTIPASRGAGRSGAARGASGEVHAQLCG